MRASVGRVGGTVIVAALVLAVLAGLAWFGVVGPRLDSASRLAAQAADIELANLQLRTRYNQALDLLDGAEQAATEAQDLFSSMPSEAELPIFLTQIADAARAAGIPAGQLEVISTSLPVPISTAAVEGGVNLASVDVSVTARGSRPELLALLDNLQNLDRALLITSSQLTTERTTDGSPVSETLQIGAAAFVLQSRLPDLVTRMDELIATIPRRP